VFDEVFADPTLIGRLKRGENDAYKQFLAGITPLLHAYFRRWKISRADVPDLAAITIRNLYRSGFELYEPERGRPGSLVFKAAENVGKDYLRKRTQIQELPLDAFPHLQYELDSSSLDDPDASSKRAILQSAIDSLTEEERSILHRRLQGESHREISKKLRISEGAVKARVRRATQKLKQAVAKQNPGANVNHEHRDRQ
jgi:RNA polymerase sigma factor (sigma-70 family)